MPGCGPDFFEVTVKIETEEEEKKWHLAWWLDICFSGRYLVSIVVTDVATQGKALACERSI